MNTGVKVAAAVASGYLLGRTKKLKLAIAVGGLLMGKRLATDPRELVKQGVQYLQSSPELSRLIEQVRGTLLEAARAAAVSTASNRLESLSDSLHERTERWRGAATGEEAEEPEEEAEEAEEPEEEAEEAEEPAAKSTKKAPAKKSASTGKKAAQKTARQTSGSKRTGGTAKKSSSSGTRSTQ